jgi:hypothetical protein
MLQNNKAIVAPPESGFSHWWLSKWGSWGKENNDEETVSLFVDDVLGSRKIELWKLECSYLKSIILYEKPNNYNELTQCIYLAYGLNYEDVKVIADKNNYYIKHLDDLPKIWPNAKYLYIIRDGRDVACSYLDVSMLNSKSPYKPIFPKTIGQIAEEWEKNNLSIEEFLAKSRRESLMIKYEDLVLNPTNTLLEICKFLNVEFDNQMLSYYESSSQNNQEPSELLDWKTKTMEKPDGNRVKRFLKDLGGQEIEVFNKVAAHSLHHFGYL